MKTTKGKVRPDYIVCITKPSGLSGRKIGEMICGRIELGFTFLDITHAYVTALREDRLLICPECCTKVIQTLIDGRAKDDGE